LAIESLLGRSVSEGEQVSIRAITVSSGAKRLDGIEQNAQENELDSLTPEVVDDEDSADRPDRRPIWEVIADNMKDVPAEEFAKLPKDGASEHDHYLYGHPKRNQ
jgi:hypothetical protein